MTGTLVLSVVFAAAAVVAAWISLELGISVALVELVGGVVIGNTADIYVPTWMSFIAVFAPIVLTFLAGSEIDVDEFRESWRESVLLGGASFGIPFAVVLVVVRFLLHWQTQEAEIAALALSTTSVAVVYSVLLEGGLAGSLLGKRLLTATFVTDLLTAALLSILFVRLTWWLIPYVAVSVAMLVVMPQVTPWFFERYKGSVIEPEIKVVFAALLLLLWLGNRAHAHAFLPTFLLGLALSRTFTANPKEQERIRVVSFAFLTPFFFLKSGLDVSLSALIANVPLLGGLFALRMVPKLSIYPIARRVCPGHGGYATLLMSTGLTFGTIASLYGLRAKIIDQTQFSLLLAVVVLSALIPTTVAHLFLHPHDRQEGSDIEVG